MGILVEPDNALTLAEGILTLIDNRDLRERLGTFAWIRAVEKYNWSRTAGNLLMAYSGILNSSMR